jgi:fumarate hydratase subunit beta
MAVRRFLQWDDPVLKQLTTPVAEEAITELQVGDVVYLTGELFTARDRAHHRLLEYLNADKGSEIPIPPGAILYHCGPVVRRWNEAWEVLAAGPTTSSRMDLMTPSLIEQLQIRGIIGKGGMGDATRAAMQRHGCVYLAMTGGAAVLASARIKAVKKVYWIDLGMAEAVWQLGVVDFGPLVVGIDAHGTSLYERVTAEARRQLAAIIPSP